MLQASVEAFGMFVTESLQASPFQSFLVLVFIHIASIAATSWLMVQWLVPGPFDQAIPSKKCSSCERADTMEAGGNDTASRSEEWDKK